MNPGELRHRVTIQQKSVTRDDLGAEVITWADVATVWAAVEPLSGREFFASQQINAEISTRIRLRYRSGVTAAMRILFGTRVFEIVAPPIDAYERHRELHLMCKEAV